MCFSAPAAQTSRSSLIGGGGGGGVIRGLPPPPQIMVIDQGVTVCFFEDLSSVRSLLVLCCEHAAALHTLVEALLGERRRELEIVRDRGP